MIRGCGTLPHVGSHPGTGTVVALILMGIAAGSKAGWRGMLLGGMLMAVFFVPMYLYGAYDRARISDQHKGK